MNKKVMFVDDEPSVLSGIRRALRGKFDVETFEDPYRALVELREGRQFAVIVSDMRMPGMDGVGFLAEARKIAPDSVRFMLTGNADQRTAIDAVNKGEIYRFLNKPCDPTTLIRTLSDGIRYYQLVRSEKELLEKTLLRSLKTVANVLAIARPEIFGRSDRIRARAREIADQLGDAPFWELDTAASLSLLGCVSLDPELLGKVNSGLALGDEDEKTFSAHPLLGAELLSNIPRMQGVANIILYQHKHFDGTGFPPDDSGGNEIPYGARILHVALAFDELRAQGKSEIGCLEELEKRQEQYDPKVLEALADCIEETAPDPVSRVPLDQLIDGMTIQEDVVTSKGILLVCQGQRVTLALRQHLEKHFDDGTLKGKVSVNPQVQSPSTKSSRPRPDSGELASLTT